MSVTARSPQQVLIMKTGENPPGASGRGRGNITILKQAQGCSVLVLSCMRKASPQEKLFY